MADITPEEQIAVNSDITEEDEQEEDESIKPEDEYIQKLRDEVKLICQKLLKMGEDSVFLTANSSKKFCNFFGSPTGEEFLINRIQVVKEFYTFCAGVARYKMKMGVENDDDVIQEVNTTGSENSNQETERLTEEKIEVINQLMSANMRKSYNEASKEETVIHTCLLCDKVFNTNTTLRKHVIKCHNKVKSHKCVICKKVFYTAIDLNHHLSFHGIGEKRFECHLCNKRFCTGSGMFKHLRNHSSAQSYTCKHCGLKEKDLSIFRRHIIQHNMQKYSSKIGVESGAPNGQNSNEDQEENDRTDEVLSNGDPSAESEMKNETNSRKKKSVCKFECKECGEKFLTSLTLKRHATKCKAIKTMSCDICNAKFKQIYLLEKHQRLKHNVNKQFKCDRCGESFKQKYLLLRHKKIICGNEGETREEMETEHMEMIFKCNDCGTQFADADSVQRHIEASESLKLSNAFKCEKCCQRFLTKRLLSKHIATHDQQSRKCDFCNKTFVTVETLLQHMENEGHFKFSCKTCGQEFQTDSELRDHTKVHDND